jgi:hypothetical protein
MTTKPKTKTTRKDNRPQKVTAFDQYRRINWEMKATATAAPIESAAETLSQHLQEMCLVGLVGVGVRRKIPEIIVYVERTIRRVGPVPTAWEGYPVRLQVVGRARLA